jgi:hypothetical protein
MTEHAKEVGIDPGAPHLGRPCLADGAFASAAHRRHRCKRRRRRIPELHEGFVHHRLDRSGLPGERHQQSHGDETIGIRVRQRPEEHAVERGEERCGGAEAERQHQDGRERERRPT